MSQHDAKHADGPQFQAHCCPCTPPEEAGREGFSRRRFLGGVGAGALGGMALTGLSWSALSAAEAELDAAPPRKPLKVKPILVYSTPTRRQQTSWRNWGGIQTQQDAEQEVARIRGEIDAMKKKADFPVEFLPVAPVRGAGDLNAAGDVKDADVAIVYAAGGWGGAFRAVTDLGKPMIVFCRHKSGPVYLWYEIVHPRYLRQHTDKLAVDAADYDDVVVDDLDEVLWRLRAHCGLVNTVGSTIVALGGAGGWAQPGGKSAGLARDRFQLDIREISYDDLGKLIQDARADEAAVKRANERAAAYLKIPNTTLETEKEFVERCFLLEEIFRRLMKEADCRAFTINHCMGTIMPASETTACLPLCTLNDDGYLAFCESDFVVVPSGILMGNITGKPPFLHNPTYPHHGLITLAHCTAPRKMDGKTLEPVRIVTHFESDYGAAPKVEMRKGQQLTMLNPDFEAECYMGLTGTIVDHPFLPICRSQIDVKPDCCDKLLTEKMRGFHWMTVYGNYLREAQYALKRVGIGLERLG